MKTGHDALGTAGNDFGCAKQENGSRHPCFRQNMKKGPDDLGTAENESGRAKHDNGSRRTRHRKK
jgi:hypothetical protein